MSDLVGAIHRPETVVKSTTSLHPAAASVPQQEKDRGGSSDGADRTLPRLEHTATAVEFDLDRETGRLLLALVERDSEAVLRSVPLVMAGFGPDPSTRGALVDATI